MTTPTTEKCPHCKGKDIGPTCALCSGSGSIPLRNPAWVKTGKWLKSERLENGETTPACARRNGVSVEQVQHAELGLIDPSIIKLK